MSPSPSLQAHPHPHPPASPPGSENSAPASPPSNNSLSSIEIIARVGGWKRQIGLQISTKRFPGTKSPTASPSSTPYPGSTTPAASSTATLTNVVCPHPYTPLPNFKLPSTGIRIQTTLNALSSGFPYSNALFSLSISPADWSAFTAEIVSAARISIAQRGLVVGTALGVGIAGMATPLGPLSVGPAIVAGKVVYDAVKVRKVKDGLEGEGKLGEVLRRWNEDVFGAKGVVVSLEVPAEAVKREKTKKKLEKMEKKRQKKEREDKEKKGAEERRDGGEDVLTEKTSTVSEGENGHAVKLENEGKFKRRFQLVILPLPATTEANQNDSTISRKAVPPSLPQNDSLSSVTTLAPSPPPHSELDSVTTVSPSLPQHNEGPGSVTTVSSSPPQHNDSPDSATTTSPSLSQRNESPGSVTTEPPPPLQHNESSSSITTASPSSLQPNDSLSSVTRSRPSPQEQRDSFGSVGTVRPSLLQHDDRPSSVTTMSPTVERWLDGLGSVTSEPPSPSQRNHSFASETTAPVSYVSDLNRSPTPEHHADTGDADVHGRGTDAEEGDTEKLLRIMEERRVSTSTLGLVDILSSPMFSR